MLDRTDGTAPPLADFARARFNIPGGGVCCGVPGGVVGPPRGFGRIAFGADGVPFFVEDPPPPPRPPPPPVTVNVFVNDGVRFDAAGHYRLYLADPHDAQQTSDGEPKPPPLVSNIVEFDITARDPEWRSATARAIAGMEAALDESASAFECVVPGGARSHTDDPNARRPLYRRAAAGAAEGVRATPVAVIEARPPLNHLNHRVTLSQKPPRQP